MNSTGIKENYFDYALFYNNFTCLSDINCFGVSRHRLLGYQFITVSIIYTGYRVQPY